VARRATPAQYRTVAPQGTQTAPSTPAQDFCLKYLLDTNICIALINEKSPFIGTRFLKELAAGAQLFVPSIIALELWYGVAKSMHEMANAQRVRTFFAGHIAVLPFEEEDARIGGRIRAAIEAVGKPVGAYDLLIASQALRHEMILVTANTREFARIKNLQWEDWTKS
jgi:tRNA(fMet)-specific endonuclease VapC